MAKFYQAKLTEVEGNVIDHVYPQHAGPNQMTLKERLGDSECPRCPEEAIEYGLEKQEKYTRWMLLPDESAAVSQGGKPYIECLDCGYLTHL